jgi:hypothetical protein
MALALIVCGAVLLIPALVTLLQAGVSALHHRGAIWVADRRRRDVADWEYLGSDRRDAVEGRRSGSSRTITQVQRDVSVAKQQVRMN